MPHPLNTGPAPAAPAAVSTNVKLALLMSFARTMLSAIGFTAGVLQAYRSGHLTGVVSYLQANEAAADALMLAGASALGWGLKKLHERTSLLAKAAADPRIRWIEAKLSSL